MNDKLHLLNDWPGYPGAMTITPGSRARWDGQHVTATLGEITIQDDPRFPQFWGRPYVGQRARAWRIQAQHGADFLILDTDPVRRKLFLTPGYWYDGPHQCLADPAGTWTDLPQPHHHPMHHPEHQDEPADAEPQQPRRVFGFGRRPKTKSALRTGFDEVQIATLSDAQIQNLRDINPAIDRQIQDAAKQRNTVQVFQAVTDRAILVVSVDTDPNRVQEISAFQVMAGTDWARRQRSLELIQNLRRDAQELNRTFIRL